MKGLTSQGYGDQLKAAKDRLVKLQELQEVEAELAELAKTMKNGSDRTVKLKDRQTTLKDELGLNGKED